MGERCLHTAEVTGSNPVSPTLVAPVVPTDTGTSRKSTTPPASAHTMTRFPTKNSLLFRRQHAWPRWCFALLLAIRRKSSVKLYVALRNTSIQRQGEEDLVRYSLARQGPGCSGTRSARSTPDAPRGSILGHQVPSDAIVLPVSTRCRSPFASGPVVPIRVQVRTSSGTRPKSSPARMRYVPLLAHPRQPRETW